jgi:hypothetical protein
MLVFSELDVKAKCEGLCIITAKSFCRLFYASNRTTGTTLDGMATQSL